jgi:hypothetical protein
MQLKKIHTKDTAARKKLYGKQLYLEFLLSFSKSCRIKAATIYAKVEVRKFFEHLIFN